MHILLTTYGLLLLFVMYSAAQWRSATNMVFMDALAIEQLAQTRTKSLGKLSNKSRTLYTKEKGKMSPPQSKLIASKIDSTAAANENALISEEEEEDAPIEIPEEEPAKRNTGEKRTSHLHIGALFRGENPTHLDGQGKAAFTLLKNLLTSMYGDQKFFKDAKAKDPEFEEHFLLDLIEQAQDAQQENMWMNKVMDINSLELNDANQMYARYKMLKGTKSRYEPDHEAMTGYYSIDDFASMTSRKNTVMSLWLAPKELLMALFQDADLVQEVLEVRRDGYYDLKNGKTTEQTIAQDLRLRYSSHIQGFDANFIDFNVTKTRPHDMPKRKRAHN